ncbi:Carboxylesterase NlhH [Rubripirellula obstinata]|uniref:Carboxylesterase NlhH n=1 Tax=Rubripirellula obstinata TaxID=406547 RepID=A0A5B1CIK1_9BACT|nr:alpha/beta hydrolase [Rubripirellula obstinata]KAA1260928.1 Carboxylesterase NlhH [Rubripirellula obstinata]
MLKLFYVSVLLISGTCLAAEPVAKPDAATTADITIQWNQRYSANAKRFGFCDVYLPGSAPPVSGYPVVLVIHGGGWMSGDKWTLESYCRSLADVGIAAVSINYRLAPDDKFPSQIDDVRSAMLWTREQSKSLSLDMQKFGLFGYSAGGHLALLAASLADETIKVQAAASDWSVDDPRWKLLPPVKAVCAGGPPCDFENLPIDNTAMAYFLGGSRRERSELYTSASPLAHVSKDDPATKIIHGDQDIIVPIAGAKVFGAKQKELGVDHHLSVISGQGHMLTFLNPRTRQLMVKFFRDQYHLN